MKELKKQLIDQPLHLLMGIVSVCLFGWFFKGNMWLACGFTAAWEAVREYLQWPSSRFYDPYLDAVFEILGIYLGYLVWMRFFA